MQSATLASLLTHHHAPEQPFVTYYDLSSGERTELSVRTMVNWVAKTANFLDDVCDSPTRIRVGVPTHWLRIVWLLAAWRVGAAVVDSRADVALCGPELAADESLRVASALHPFGLAFPTPPPGFIDFGAEAAGQPDVFIGLDSPTPDTVALDTAGRRASHATLLAIAPDARRRLVQPGTIERDAELVVAAALGGGSLVVAAHAPDAAAVDRVAAQENATTARIHSGE